MALKYLLLLTVVSAVVNCSVVRQSSVAQSFIDNEVVPDLVSFPPQLLLTVEYPSGVSVQLGNELTPTEVKDLPTLSWDADNDSFYTLAMIDIDAPARAYPENRGVNHWLVGNIPGTDVSVGETIAEYIGSGPSFGTGLHRYVFVIFEQPGILEFDEPRISNTSSENRPQFTTYHFAEKYGLGEPLAGNFYLAEYDDYVPILHEQLGIA